MVNVTKSNFVEQSNDLLDHLPTAALVAIDEEMTGIQLPGTGRPRKDQCPADRYPSMKQVPERYSIIQLGVCLFHAVENNHSSVGQNRNSSSGSGDAATGGNNHNNNGGREPEVEWRVRRYNFYMFPQENHRGDKHPSREVVLNPGSVAFLNQHNMNFDLWVKEGIPYQMAGQASDTIQHYVTSQRAELEQEVVAALNAGNATVQETVRRRVELRRTEDIEFYARTMASLREWLDAAHPPSGGTDTAVLSVTNASDIGIAVAQGKCFILPACNSFMRRAFYESIGKEYPCLDLERNEPQNPNQIRVWRLTTEEKAARKKRLRQDAWNTMIRQKVGMWRVFEALSRVARGEELRRDSVLFASSYEQINWGSPGNVLDVSSSTFPGIGGGGRKIPIVVHNGFMDLCFLLTHFHASKLPESLPQCKALIRSYFPTVYDTKVVSSECTTAWNNEMTNLSNLFQKTVIEEGEGLLERLTVVEAFLGNSVSMVDGPGSVFSSADQEHEAAYDAYMTGCVYIRLCNHIRESNRIKNLTGRSARGVGNLTHLLSEGSSHDEQVKFLYGRNRLFQLSMYTMDLDNAEDPLSRGMLPDSTYRVTGIDPSVSTRDIVRCLSGLHDGTRQVNFEIIWVDDTTFLVAASYQSLPQAAAPPPEEVEEGEVEEDEGAEANGDSGAAKDDSTEVLMEHGRLIHSQLRARFQTESIVTLSEHLNSLHAEDVVEEPQTWLSRVWQLLGMGGNKRKLADTTAGQRSAKRRRRE